MNFLPGLIVLITITSVAEDFKPRVDVLKMHLGHLQAITVKPADRENALKQLETLAQAVQKDITSEESFNSLYREIDTVRQWLLDHSLNPPQVAEGKYEELGKALVIGNSQIQLSIQKEDLALAVKTASTEWRFAPADETDLELDGKNMSLIKAGNRVYEPFRTGYGIGAILTFSNFPEMPRLKVVLGFHLIGNEILCEVSAPLESPVLKGVNWPKAVVFDTQSASDFSVLPFMQGVLLPANWPKEMHYKGGLTQTRWFYMPWWGQIRNGHGVQTIIETTYDGGGYYVHPEGGPTTIRPHWFSSLGRLRYQRRVMYVFEDQATYVTMAKRYRRYVQENGQFVSLKEKAARNPKVESMLGRPVVHLGSLYHFVPESGLYHKDRIENNHTFSPFSDLAAMLHELKNKGIESAYVHLDGWGFRGYDSAHPDVLPPGEEQGGWEGLRAFAETCRELGYLFAVHDNYRDFYTNAASFSEKLALQREDGSFPKDSTWCGGPQLFLSARFAQEYVRRNHDLFAAHGVHLDGAYLDVFAVADLDESFQAAHPMTREDCAHFRRSCFDLLRARGYVVSSEEPVDFSVPSLDLVHHGPYPTWKNLGGGEAVGIPVPLFNLVYHDAILLPWDMGEDGGWGTPKGDAGRLHCLLNGGLPYVSPGASDQQIQQVLEASKLARHVALMEMVDHQFLDETKRKQSTLYSDGTRVTVDFDQKTSSIDYP